MSSRADADIARDMKYANVTSADSGRIILWKIVPVMNANSYQDEIRRPEFMLDLTFLVDQFELRLINCDHNMRELDKLVDCVKLKENTRSG